jgi:hypothetical protein
MSKFYTDKAPTPVFAVTFVSNREGIIPKEKVQTSSKSTTPQQNEEDITNPDFKSTDYKEGIEAGEKDLLNKIASIKKTQRNNPTADEKKRYDEALADYRKTLREFREKNMPTFYGPSNSSTPTIPTKDSEYLIYSNLQIQKTDDPNDLSQQSNWYLREAEVELTRDWPIQKAKLIVTCKLLDNGSIPPLVEVEKGYVWSKDKDAFVELLPEGRFLSADDEVRIYAGYKNDQCISMNDLDDYPFDFTNLEVTGDIPADSEDGLKLQQLQAEKKAIENAIQELNNPFTDISFKTFATVVIVGLSLGIGAKAVLAINGVRAAAAANQLKIAKEAAIAGNQSAIASQVAAQQAAIAQQIGTNAANAAINTVKLGGSVNSASVNVFIKTLTPDQFLKFNTAFQAARQASSTTTTAQAFTAGLKALGVNASLLGFIAPAFAEDSITKKIERDYLEGRISFNDNKQLKDYLITDLNGVNNYIQVIQRKAGVKDKTYFADENKIAPIFWGFIDSVDFISNSNAGVQIIYNLRDRSRILADTKLVTLPFLGTDANNKNTFEGLKHKTVESVYRATNGGIYLDNNYVSATSLAWRSGFDKGQTINLYEDKDKKITDTKSALAKERLKFTAAIEDPARWVIANAFLSSGDLLNKTDYNNFDPLFHIWTLQPPLISGSGNNTMQIINKSPFEILSYLAMTEVMSIDIFTSHINGHFMFAPRILDTTGLYDEQRGNRLYYFFDCFDKLPEQRSLIKDIRVQTSTVGVYNRFTVLTADFGSSTNASLSGLTSIVDIASANTKNRKVPIKQHVIVDPKIKASEGNKEGAAQALALTTASTMARDHTMIIFKIIGDSSFYPGEAVRVFNTVLHSKDIFTFNATSTSSAVFLKSLYDEVQKLLNSAVKQQGTNNKVVDLSAVIDSMRKVAGAPSDDLNGALPMYKVRGITHSLKANGNDAGYTTKIVAVADIL